MATNSQLTIKWVNHASYIVSYKDISIITDPWLFGTAFNNGWDLLVESEFSPDDFDKVTHIWVSHEHPDHFAPHVLKAIPEEKRKNLKFLFQETKDKKVKGFCENLGFDFQELEPTKKYELTDGLTIQCAPMLDDSWLYLEADGHKVLNINDCIVNSTARANEIKDITGEVDLLMTQFSYAQWVGNPEDVDVRESHAKEKLERIKLQIDAFNPEYTIPFASFVWFSHEENFFLNSTVNRIPETVDVIENSGSKPIVLFPQDEYIVGQDHDSSGAIEKYEKAFETLDERDKRKSDPTPVEEVIKAADGMLERAKEKNSLLPIRLAYFFRVFRKAKIHLSDIDETYTFDLISGLKKKSIKKEKCDISLSCESLAYALKFDWGADTLMINGRFYSPNRSQRNFFTNFFVLRHNNAGRKYSLTILRRDIFRNLGRKLNLIK